MASKEMVYQMWVVAPNMTNSEVAEALHTNASYVRCAASRMGIAFAQGKRGRPLGSKAKK